jgi:hypothetical protein
MSLVLRRARAARSLLLAATGVTLIATTLLAGLAGYSRAVVTAGARDAVSSATVDERSMLVRGSAGRTAGELAQRDAALRARLAGGLAGHAVTVSGAGYATGRQLTGPTGDAVPDTGGAVYASVVFLQNLAEHAELDSGAWPRPGIGDTEAALAEPVAAILGVGVGDRMPVTDRVTGKVSRLLVTGLWHPRDPADPYWQLVPDVAAGVSPQSATYGPIVVDRADFDARFLRSASAGWLVLPDLSGASITDVSRLAQAARVTAAALPGAAGLGTSALVTTRVDRLEERLARGDLVGRSGLVTPMLLVSILSGLALMLVAALLIEHRRGESALLRARGAARLQLAGLAGREALLVVVPAAVAAPWLAASALRLGGEHTAVHTGAIGGPDRLLWVVAAGAALGCALAITVPALRGGGTYVEEMAGNSRPARRSAVQRVGVDLALVALAVLGWFQLRQYSSPLAGSAGSDLGIDPFLASAPTLGVLAGATLALRLLPPAGRLVERWVDRRDRTGMVFGMWQAGRRPHAGPVLLLALAVAASTVAWCLAGSAGRSTVDQADHSVGADLRLVETGGVTSADRAARIAGLPGLRAALPAWRAGLVSGTTGEPAALLALDAAAAPGVVHIRPDLAGGDASGLFRAMAAERVTAPVIDLPAGARRLTGTLSGARTQTEVVFTGTAGDTLRLPLGDAGRFSVALPATPAPLRLAGFLVTAKGLPGAEVRWSLTGLGTESGALTLGDAWQAVGRSVLSTNAEARGSVLRTGVQVGISGEAPFAVVRRAADAPVPVLATPQALAALHLEVGKRSPLRLAGTDLSVQVVGTVKALPGTTEPAAVLADLPSLTTTLLTNDGIVRPTQEWWLAVAPATRTETATAAGRLAGVQVLDRHTATAAFAGGAYGEGARIALFAAALGAILLAAVGITVDVRTTARRRITELAVLHTLGAGSRLLARSIMVEQAFLSGMGVLVGLAVGLGVAATMAPLLILTPTAGRPVPAPVLEFDWRLVAGTALLLLVLALGLSALVGTTLRRRLAVAQLRIGADR